MGIITEYVLVYAKNKSKSPPFIGGLTTKDKKYPLNNAGNSLRILTFPKGSVIFKCKDQVFHPQDMSEGNVITKLLDKLEVRNGKNVNDFRLEGEWRYSQETVNEIISNNELLVISKAPFRPNHIKSGGEPKKIKNLLSITHFDMKTYEDATLESEALFGSDAFDYPKPEKLISTLIGSICERGDIVLDSFGGSGTTAAVAHKLGLKWIIVELGEHCHTHIIPRLKQVIDGKDQGGITNDTEWQGGGGYRYYKLAPSLLEKDKWGQWVINKEYNPNMLASAICRHEGFMYSPSETEWWVHGHSTERDFIYVTTQIMTEDQLLALAEDVGSERTLLICCSAFKASADLLNNKLSNLTLKKIPNAIMTKCEWGKDDYSLNINNLPQANIEKSIEQNIKSNKDKTENLFSDKS
jgi:adenine-specific DNA-methyltransferase